MPIQATVSGGPQISASVSENHIGVSVAGSKVEVSVAGGGASTGFTTLEAATDVNLEASSEGDVLRYSSGKWRNYPDANLVDGGNW